MTALIIINIIGVLVFFLNRYSNRKVKDKFNAWFWLEDNMIELAATLLINVAIMMILCLTEVEVNPSEFVTKYIPFDIIATGYAGKMLVSFLTGLVFASLAYGTIKRIKKIKL